jgi:hypothetical protein
LFKSNCTEQLSRNAAAVGSDSYRTGRMRPQHGTWTRRPQSNGDA